MHYLVGDLHLGDPSVIKYRKQFPTLGYHDQYICDEVLAPLNKHDLLTMVGDCLVGSSSLELIKKFPCRKRLVMGNHDTEKKFNFSDLVGVVDEVVSSYNSKGFTVTHIPIHPLHLRGRRNIHAHLHDQIIEDPRYVGVSLEQTGYKLITIEEILTGEYRTFRGDIPECIKLINND